MNVKIGNIELDTDTIQVLVFVGLATGAIVTFTGIGMLANNWNSQANPDREAVDYSHVADDHGGGH